MNSKSLMKQYCLKKKFYCNFNMEDIMDADYTHAKRIWKDIEIKKID